MKIAVAIKRKDETFKKWYAWYPVKVFKYVNGRPILIWVWLEWIDRCLYQRTIDDLGLRPRHYSYRLIE